MDTVATYTAIIPPTVCADGVKVSVQDPSLNHTASFLVAGLIGSNANNICLLIQLAFAFVNNHFEPLLKN
jgi:hypothetical protein